jgi:hypothetical protein
MGLLDNKIEEGHDSCLCPLCDDAIVDGESHMVVIAHMCKYIVHKACYIELAAAEDIEGEL